MTQATRIKYFTLAQANKTLPYVRRVVEDIIAEYQEWKDCIHRYELVAAGVQADHGETEEQVALRLRVDDVARRINRHIEELNAVGCVFKGFDGGLVDFYARLEGRDVFLCWRLGEAEIAYWHDVDAGFSGRQPITSEPFGVEDD
jgi:hypothetical protein